MRRPSGDAAASATGPERPQPLSSSLIQSDLPRPLATTTSPSVPVRRYQHHRTASSFDGTPPAGSPALPAAAGTPQADAWQAHPGQMTTPQSTAMRLTAAAETPPLLPFDDYDDGGQTGGHPTPQYPGAVTSPDDNPHEGLFAPMFDRRYAAAASSLTPSSAALLPLPHIATPTTRPVRPAGSLNSSMLSDEADNNPRRSLHQLNMAIRSSFAASDDETTVSEASTIRRHWQKRYSARSTASILNRRIRQKNLAGLKQQPQRPREFKDLPADALRLILVAFVGHPAQLSCRLVSKRFNVVLTNACVLWYRRIPHHVFVAHLAHRLQREIEAAGPRVASEHNIIDIENQSINWIAAQRALAETDAVIAESRREAADARSRNFTYRIPPPKEQSPPIDEPLPGTDSGYISGLASPRGAATGGTPPPAIDMAAVHEDDDAADDAIVMGPGYSPVYASEANVDFATAIAVQSPIHCPPPNTPMPGMPPVLTSSSTHAITGNDTAPVASLAGAADESKTPCEAEAEGENEEAPIPFPGSSRELLDCHTFTVLLVNQLSIFRQTSTGNEVTAETRERWITHTCTKGCCHRQWADYVTHRREEEIDSNEIRERIVLGGSICRALLFPATDYSGVLASMISLAFLAVISFVVFVRAEIGEASLQFAPLWSFYVLLYPLLYVFFGSSTIEPMVLCVLGFVGVTFSSVLVYFYRIVSPFQAMSWLSCATPMLLCASCCATYSFLVLHRFTKDVTRWQHRAVAAATCSLPALFLLFTALLALELDELLVLRVHTAPPPGPPPAPAPPANPAPQRTESQSAAAPSGTSSAPPPTTVQPPTRHLVTPAPAPAEDSPNRYGMDDGICTGLFRLSGAVGALLMGILTWVVRIAIKTFGFTAIRDRFEGLALVLVIYGVAFACGMAACLLGALHGVLCVPTDAVLALGGVACVLLAAAMIGGIVATTAARDVVLGPMHQMPRDLELEHGAACFVVDASTLYLTLCPTAQENSADGDGMA